MLQRCRTCFYSMPVEDTESLLCRRYPPEITEVEGSRVTSRFPFVSRETWCGEWKYNPVPSE